MTRVLLVVSSLNGGGAEVAVLRMLKAFNAMPHISARLISLCEKNDYGDHDAHAVTFLPIPEGKSLDGLFRQGRVVQLLKQVVERHERSEGAFDVIFSHLETTHVIVSAAHFECPVFYVQHSSVQQELICQRSRGLLKYLRLKRRLKALKDKHVICVSQGAAAEFSLPWLPVKSCNVIYNPFDSSEIIELSQQGGNPFPDRPYVLHVGRVARAKRHDRLFSAFAMLDVPEVLVLLTKESRKLSRMINEYGLADRVFVAGFQENPYRYMKHARCVLLSSDYEGMPNVMIESLLVGTPFIANDCPHGPKEILAHWQPDWLAEARSAENLAQKLRQILDRPSQEFQWEQAAMFAPETCAKAYLSLICR